MWPKPKKKGKTKNKLNAIEPEKIPDGPEQIELLRKGSGSSSGVREANAQPREDISGVWKASLMKAIAPGTPSQISTDSMPKMKIPVNRDVLEAQEKQRRLVVFQAVIKVIDRMFDNFQNTAYGFNQVASGSDLELTWMRPQVREENMAAWHEGRSRLCQIFSGRISTRFWTMLVRGTDEGIGVYIMPADKVLSFTPEDKNFLCYLTMAPNFDADRNFTQFLANGLPVAEDLYPSIFRALLDALIRYANEEATPGEVFDFGEVGIVPEAPPPPKEVKETSVSSSFNAEVPRTSYAEAVQQIQAHNKAGHVDQLINTSTNARPVDPNEFARGNSGNFQGLQPGPTSTPTSSSDEWKGFSSTGTQKQFQTGSQPVLPQSGDWRTPQGQPVPDPVNPPFNAQHDTGGSGAWNFISNNEIQSHQKNSGNQQIPPGFHQQQFQQPQQQQPQPPFQPHQQQSEPFRHPLEQQAPPQNLKPHSMADSGIISEFTMPDFQRPSRAELEQLREGARPPINQSQEIAGVAPLFNPPSEPVDQRMEQQQFELLSENPPEMSGDFAPITISENYAESEELMDESQEDEFDAISESESDHVEEFSSQELEEQVEELVEDSNDETEFSAVEFEGNSQELDEVEGSGEKSHHKEEAEHVDEESQVDDIDSENVGAVEEFDDDEEIEEIEEVDEVEEDIEISDDQEPDDEISEDAVVSEDVEDVEDAEDVEESEEVNEIDEDEESEEVEDLEDSHEVEKSDQSESFEDTEDTQDTQDTEESVDDEIVEAESDESDQSEESEEAEDEDADESEQDEEAEDTEDIEDIEESEEAEIESEAGDSVLDDSSDSDHGARAESDELKISKDEDESQEKLDEKVEAEAEAKVDLRPDSNESEKAESSKNSEIIASTSASDSKTYSDIGSRSSGGEDKAMPAFTKFPSLPIVEITLGRCPDLSDALSVLLPVLDAQIDELAAQGGKAFTTKDFKRAEAIIKLTEKLEDFKTEASSILNLIDDDEDEEE